MTVLVTGGTGFVGSHVTRQLRAAGRPVRLLVRSPGRARQLFGQDDQLTLCPGDVSDLDAVKRALSGCDSLVHCAAATPMKDVSDEQLFAVNVGGVKNVVGCAIEQGMDRIVCISSITAIFNPDASKVTVDAEPVPSKMPYGRSKREAELYLREQQAAGAPIAIVYPGGVLGPDDPGISDSCRAIQHRVANGFRLFSEGGIEGGMQYIDVRDLAAFACSLALEGGSGRFLAPGVFSTWSEQADMIEAVSGCTLTRIPAQGWKLRLVGRMMDLLRLIRTVDSPISAETMGYATRWPRIPNTEELGRRGITLRDPVESFDDTLRWMVAAGHLSAGQCPRYGANHD